MTTIMNTVLAVGELFENILLHLPTRDLLLAQRVSRKWHSVISSSPDLQKALFFKPASDSSAYVYNDLLAEVFPPWFRQYHTHPTISFARKREFEMLPWIADSQAKREAVMCEEASWRRMLVCQPAVSLIVRERGGQRRIMYHEARLELVDGLRMGVLYDLAQKWVFGHRVSCFGTEWSTFPKPTKDDTINYDGYMTCGTALNNLKVDAEGSFEPTPWVTLNLSYVVQCVQPDFGYDGKEFESRGQQRISLVFDEKRSWPDDPEVDQYFRDRRRLRRSNAS